MVGTTETVTATGLTSTVTAFSTTVSTSTVPATDVPRTVTVVTMSVSTEAATVTTTTTTTSTRTEVATATATLYSACGDDNIAGPLGPNGHYLSSFNGLSGGQQLNQLSADTAYDCCVACILDSECQFSVYSDSVGQCATVSSSDGECVPSSPVGTVYESLGLPSVYPLYVSNGYCGVVHDGGIASDVN